MSADLHLELARRNARLRAWRSVGVPVEGGWEIRDGLRYLRLGCATCQRWCDGYPDPDEMLLSVEHRYVRRLNQYPIHCPHLLREIVLLPDPPELAATWELELLAGV